MISSRLKSLFYTNENKRLVANFFSLVVLRGFQFLIPLITLPYLVRTIGIENFGLVNFALSLCIYFGAIIQFGFGITATREISRHRDDPIKLAQIYSVTLTASISLALVSAALFTAIVLSFEKFNNNLDLYFFTFVFIVFQSLFPIWFFQGMEKMKYITFLSLSASVFFLVTLFVFVKQKDDFVLVPMLNAISAMMTFIFALVLIKKQFKIDYMIPEWQEIKKIYTEGNHAFITQLVPNLYTNSVTFFLGFFAGNAVVGLFVSASKIIDAVGSTAYIFSNACLPLLSRNIDRHNAFQKIMLAVGLALTIVLIAATEKITTFMYGSINNIVTLYVQALALAIPLIFIQITYGSNYLMLTGNEKQFKSIVLLASVGSLFYSTPLIYIYGAWGAICTLVITRAIISFSTYRAYLANETRKRNSFYV